MRLVRVQRHLHRARAAHPGDDGIGLEGAPGVDHLVALPGGAAGDPVPDSERRYRVPLEAQHVEEAEEFLVRSGAAGGINEGAESAPVDLQVGTVFVGKAHVSPGRTGWSDGAGAGSCWLRACSSAAGAGDGWGGGSAALCWGAGGRGVGSGRGIGQPVQVSDAVVQTSATGSNPWPTLGSKLTTQPAKERAAVARRYGAGSLVQGVGHLAPEPGETSGFADSEGCQGGNPRGGEQAQRSRGFADWRVGSHPDPVCHNDLMKTDGFTEVLRREGTLLADAAAKAGLEAEVPSCPGWRVADLVRHQGLVHRWATRYIEKQHTKPTPIAGDTPADAVLLPWFREGHEGLVHALSTAPPDLECWYFLRAPSPLEFWARRQAHETTVHRVDAELALGDVTLVDPDFAADGVDELLAGFHVRDRSRVRSEQPRTLRVRAVDVPDAQGDWLVHISREPPTVERAGEGRADCTISGPATELYLALWNRGPYEALEISGDDSLIELWRRTGAIV
jgi:uncharacterized protein (TIGR03083 family)